MASGWRYILARSDTMTSLGQLRLAHDRKLDVDLNKSGSASCWIPTRAQQARIAVPWATCLIVSYAGTPYWSGPIVSRQTSLKAGTVQLPAVGWFERLMHLLNQADKSYASQDIGAIISDQLALARIQDPNLPITLGTVQTSVSVSMVVKQDQSFGSVIQQLVDVESGVDWNIDPITRQLNIFARRGIDRPDCKWTFIGDGRSRNSNLSDVVEMIDGAKIVNAMTARGRYGSPTPATDLASQASYGIFQEVANLSDVVDTNILNAYANAEIVYRSQPRVTYALTPKPNIRVNVPKMFRDFDIGDTTYLTARRDFVDVEGQATRIFGVGLDISDAGVESIRSLHTSND